jgi:hypothetical protein
MARVLEIWRSWSVRRRLAVVGSAAVVVVGGVALVAYLVTKRPADVSNDVPFHAQKPQSSKTVDWPLYGPKLAQVGLTFGADDVDGVSPVEETGEGRRRAPLEEIRRNITAASGEPIERDGLFRPRR